MVKSPTSDQAGAARSARHRPINPPVAQGPRGKDLPAYVANGLVGLRVRENPLSPGMCLVSGFAGEHHERRIEAAAAVPYPLSGDLALDGVWMGDQPEGVELIDQAYDFATAELTSRLAVTLGAGRAQVEVVTFCSRTHPTLVCQLVTIEVDAPCELMWRARIDPAGVRGRQARRRLATPGESEPVCDGAILWGSEGDRHTCGLALVTEGPPDAERTQEPWDRLGPLSTTYRARATPGRRRRFAQIVSLVPSCTHSDPDNQAVRLAAQARGLGLDDLRRRNRAVWTELWKSRIRLEGAGERWQALTDAAFFYLNCSVHRSSPASTSIFGLATWHDYHYYFGHVMWDIEAFAAPPLIALQPEAARAILDFRSRSLESARNNARLQGFDGLQFPWEAGPAKGEEATPGGADAAAKEVHVSLHVARAFGLFADMTGDQRFLREWAWPVLAGVADWIVDRVSPVEGGYGFLEIGGPAERKANSDNDALTIMAARVVLARASEAAAQLGLPPVRRWREVEAGLNPPMREDGAIASHEGYLKTEEKGATPSPLMGLFPYWAPVDPATEAATLDFYLGLWRDYVGSPMLAALYGVWAAWAGDPALSLRLLDEGYGLYHMGRFNQALEYRMDKFPEGVAAGPFFANIGGFLTGLIFGFPGLKPSSADPSQWASRPVVLPKGWEAISCDRLWLRGKVFALEARHGEPRARLTPARLR